MWRGSFLQRNHPGFVTQGGNDFLNEILGGEPEGAGVDAGMAAKEGSVQHILIDQQTNPVLFVVHQTQDTEAARGDVQKLLHEFRSGEGQPGGSNLLGQLAGFENLIAGDQQQVKVGTLAVAQQQIFAGVRAQGLVNIGAGLHGHGSFVIDPVVPDAQSIQKIVAPDFFFQSIGLVRGPTV